MNRRTKEQIKIIIFACTLSFFSCVQKVKQATNRLDDVQIANSASLKITTDQLKEIQLDPDDKGYMYDDLIDSVSFIKLQTTDNNLMAYADKIFFTKDKIIVVDYTKLKTILVYDYNGFFLYKISRRGLGPDEYRTLDYATLSLDKSQIVAVDMGANKLKHFSIDNATANITGSFLFKTEKLPYIFSDIEFLEDNIIAGYYSGGNQVPNTSDLHLFILSDLNKNIYYSGYKSYYSKKFNYSPRSHFHKYGSTLFFCPSYNDTVFIVNKKRLEAHYVVNIKGHKDIILKEDISNEEFSQILESTNYFKGNFVELKDITIFDYTSNLNRFTWGIYVKSENRTYNCNGKLRNPIMGFCNETFYYKDNIVVKPVSASFLLTNKEYILKAWDSSKANELFHNLTEDDNPVLLFYHMKTKIN